MGPSRVRRGKGPELPSYPVSDITSTGAAVVAGIAAMTHARRMAELPPQTMAGLQQAEYNATARFDL